MKIDQIPEASRTRFSHLAGMAFDAPRILQRTAASGFGAHQFHGLNSVIVAGTAPMGVAPITDR